MLSEFDVIVAADAAEKPIFAGKIHNHMHKFMLSSKAVDIFLG